MRAAPADAQQCGNHGDLLAFAKKAGRSRNSNPQSGDCVYFLCLMPLK